MSQESPAPDQYISRPDVEDKLFAFIDQGKTPIHVAGEPGVGKTSTIEKLHHTYEDEHDITNHSIGKHHQIADFYGTIYRSILDQLPEDQKEEGKKLTGVGGSAAGFGASVSWDTASTDAPEVQLSYRDVLREIAELYPGERQLLLCIDDVHKLSSDEQTIRDAIREAADLLTDNIILVTAGRLAFDSIEATATLSTFSEDQTTELLQHELQDVSTDDAQRVHQRLGGHPLYIGLLTESNEPGEKLDIPETDMYDAIETRYLRSLSDDERRFLLATSPLQQLNERICNRVVPDRYDFDQTDISTLLRRLGDRVIAHDLGWNQTGIKSYRIHDTFRNFLRKRLDDATATHVHEEAFRYYSEQVRTLIDAGKPDLETEANEVFSCLHHLSEDIGQSASNELVRFIETALQEDGLRFYPASLILDEIKTWDTADVDDHIVTALIGMFDDRDELAQAFFDEDTHRNWAETWFQHDRFDEPDGYLLTYLNRIVDVHPEFVLDVIETTSTEDVKTRRFLTSIARELPPTTAASASETVAELIAFTEDIHGFEFQGLRLVEYLCENGEVDAALPVLEAILRPKDCDMDETRRQERKFERYSTIETLNDTYDLFLEETGRDFIEVLDKTLRRTLRTEKDETGTIQYESVDNRTPIKDLDYDETNTGKRKHIIYTYLSRAVEQWVDDNPDNNDRTQLLEEYLDDPDPNFRRLGLYLLSNHPDTHLHRTTEELLEEDNYYMDEIRFEFYRLLEQGFPYLEPENQDRICQILRDGPRDQGWVKQRAERFADEENSLAELKEQIVDRWQLKRLYLVKDSVPDAHRNYVMDLLDQHGEPETPPTEVYSPEVHSGTVTEKGPAELDDLQDWPADDVLELCVTWEPPEGKDWTDNASGGFEEVSYHGFANQLEELIKEDPQEYAAEISVLKEAKPQYVDIALHTFQDVVEQGEKFPWNPITELCEYVVEHPTQWSSRCRYDIATLLHKGIVTDGTNLPSRNTHRIEALLLEMVTETDIDEEEQPHSWIGGIGTSEEEVRQRGLDALIAYAIWRSEEGKQPLTADIREAVIEKIVADPALPVRTALGRQFGNLWALDEKLVKKHLPEIFPTGDGLETEQQFSRAWNGYIRANHCHGPAFNELRPYYRHAIGLATADEPNKEVVDKETDSESINHDATAGHIASAYIFQGDDLDDGDSLISIFYARASPELAAKIARSCARSLENSDALDGHWEMVRELWRWRLDTIEGIVQDSDDEEDYQREFYRFIDCLRHTSEAGITEEKDLLKRSVRFVRHESIGVRTIEEWLADQSTDNPEAAIEIYEHLVESATTDEWPELVRTSREELREQLYENAVGFQETKEAAFKIANRFAAEGCEMDKTFLDDHFQNQ